MKIAARATNRTPSASHLFIRTASDYICAIDPRGLELGELTGQDGDASESGQLEGVVQVVDSQQAISQQFTTEEEIAKLSARVAATRCAGATLLEGAGILGVGGVGNVEAVGPDQRRARPRQARRPDAIKEVDAGSDGIE